MFDARALLSCLLRRCPHVSVFIWKRNFFFTDDFCPYVSDLEAAEHYQVTFATGVKMRKVGSPFSLTLFLPWFWHFKLFLRLWRTSQQYKPTPKKFKDGANLLFRGLIIANTYALSKYRRVSYRCQIDSSYSYVWTSETDAKTPRVYANVFENGEKKLRFQTNTDTCGQVLSLLLLYVLVAVAVVVAK